MTFKLSSGVGPVCASLSQHPLTPDPTLVASLITYKASECGRIIPAGWERLCSGRETRLDLPAQTSEDLGDIN